MFTAAERQYLQNQRLARISTASPGGEPDVAAVGFTVEGDSITIDGFDNTRTRKYHNVRRNGRASIVIDSLLSVEPWRPQGIKVTGRAMIDEPADRPKLRIHPETVWSWGINEGTESYFAGVIEKRTVRVAEQTETGERHE